MNINEFVGDIDECQLYGDEPTSEGRCILL